MALGCGPVPMTDVHIANLMTPVPTSLGHPLLSHWLLTALDVMATVNLSANDKGKVSYYNHVHCNNYGVIF